MTAPRVTPRADDPLRICLADAYRRAALNGLDMRRAVAVLELVRERVLIRLTWSSAWEAANTAIAEHFDDRDLVAVLVEMREALTRSLLAATVARSEDAWVDTAASVLPDHPDLIEPILSVARPAGPDTGLADTVLAAAPLLDAERYLETRDAFALLVADERVSVATKARLEIALGEIALYLVEDHLMAERHFARARAHAGGDQRVATAEAQILLWRANVMTFDDEKAPLLLAASESLAPVLTAAEQIDQPFPGARVLAGDIALQWSRIYQGTTALLGGSAEEHYRRAARETPGSSHAQRSLLTYLVAKDLDRHRTEIDRGVRLVQLLEPTERGDVLGSLGKAYLDAGELELAEETLRAAIAAEPAHVNSFIWLSDAAFLRDDVDEATRLLGAADEVAPASYAVAVARASLTHSQRAWDDAVRWWREAAARLPEASPLARAAIAGLHLARGEPDLARAEAEPVCRDAIAAGDLGTAAAVVASETLLALASDVTETSDVSRADELLGLALRCRGDGFLAEYHARRAQVRLAVGLADDGIKEYEAALASAPANPMLLRELASALRDLGRWDDAAARLASMRELGDQESYALEMGLLENTRGNAHAAADDHAGAVAAYCRALAHRPADPVIHHNLSLALVAGAGAGGLLPAYREATDHVRRADQLDPARGYGEEARSLETLVQAAECLGDEFLAGISDVTRARVRVGRGAVPLVTDDSGSLEPNITAFVEDMRAQILDHRGAPVPGVLFRSVEDYPPGCVTFHVSGREVGRAEDIEGEGDLDWLLSGLRQMVVDSCDELFGPDEVLAWIGAAGRADSALSDDVALAGFTRALRAAVAERRSIADIGALAEAYVSALVRGDGEGASAEAVIVAAPPPIITTDAGASPPVPLADEAVAWLEQLYVPELTALVLSSTGPEPPESLLGAIRAAAEGGTVITVADDHQRALLGSLLQHYRVALPVIIASPGAEASQ